MKRFPVQHREKLSLSQKAVLTIWGVVLLVAALFLVLVVATRVESGAAAVPAAASLASHSPVPTDPVLDPATSTASPEPTRSPTAQRTASAQSVLLEPTSTLPPNISATPNSFITVVPFFDGPIIIGQSLDGRPIEAYRFGSGLIKRMIVAGIHGGYEWNTTLLMTELMNYLQQYPDTIPRLVSLYVITTMNPDGLLREKGASGRANSNNVDLNRNFPINWQAEWSRSGCWRLLNLSGGSGPGSEPETQAIMRYILDIRPSAVISYDSAALGIFPGGEPADPASSRLAEALAAVSGYPYPPIDTGCIYSGTLPDFAVAQGIPAVDLELHTHSSTDFEENLEILKSFLDWRP